MTQREIALEKAKLNQNVHRAMEAFQIATGVKIKKMTIHVAPNGFCNIENELYE